MIYPEYVYLLERTSEVENEWVPIRAYTIEDIADLAKARAQIANPEYTFAVQEIELVRG